MKCGVVSFACQFFRTLFRQLPVNKFAKVEADSHTVEASQAGNVLNVINIAIDRALVRFSG